MVKGLFFKIFGWFWLTIIITITATYWISSQLQENYGYDHHLDELAVHFLDVVENKLATQNRSEFHNWLVNYRLPRGIGIVVLDNSDSIIAFKNIPRRIIRFFKTQKKWPFKHDSRVKMKQKSIVSSGNLPLQAIVVMFPKRTRFESDHKDPWISSFGKRTPGWGIFRLLIALVISAIVCYLLARYFSKPIVKLRNAVNRLAKGSFETNLTGEFNKRNDEIAELAADFDGMAEKLREQFKQREDLLRDISHELRSPLARMRVASELIKSKTKNLNLKEVSRIESEIALLDNLIGEILDFSKLGNESIEVQFSSLNLSELLGNIIENANFEGKSDNKGVVMRNEDDKSVMIEANKPILQHALENIIRNAIKYTPAQTQVSVNLSMDNMIKIAIADQGRGVPETELNKIFEPFYRVSESRSRQSGGTGLGLAIAKRAIELHQGTVSAHNSQPHGLVVTIELPLPGSG